MEKQCQCLTENGKGPQCTRKTKEGETLCFQHKDCEHVVRTHHEDVVQKQREGIDASVDAGVDLTKITFDELRSYVTKDPDEEPSSCWNLAKYIFHLYGIPVNQIDESLPNKVDPDEFETVFKHLKNGTYMFTYENNMEFHYFAITINDQRVDIIQTYGGIDRLIRVSDSKQRWIDNFVKIINGDSSAYGKGLGLPKPKSSKKDLVINVIEYRKLGRGNPGSP